MTNTNLLALVLAWRQTSSWFLIDISGKFDLFLLFSLLNLLEA